MSDAAVTLRTTGRLGAVLKITPETLSADMSDKVSISIVDTALMDKLIDGSLTECKTFAQSIRKMAFYYNDGLESIIAPSATYVGQQAFQNCTALHSADFPLVTSLGYSVFSVCSALQSVNFQSLRTVPSGTFDRCTSLQVVDLPSVTTVDRNSFYGCSALQSIYLRSPTRATLVGTNAFSGCTQLAHIYVPANLVDSYKRATNWVTYASKISAIPEGE